MKTVSMLLAIMISVCSCSKKEGCTNVNSLVYDATAEKDNGTCTYISGSYSMTEQCLSTVTFTMTIVGDSSLITFNNFDNRFDTISGTRTALSFTIAAKHSIHDRTGKEWDFNGGAGLISSDGKNLTLTSYSLSDAAYQNVIGTLYCSASGIK